MNPRRFRFVVAQLFVLFVCGCGAAEPPAEPAKHDPVRGSLSKAVIRKVIREQIAMIEQCANAFARAGERGLVTVRFVIGTTGEVTEAEIVESALANARLEKCILAAPQYWHFPPPDGGGVVIVTYPFEIAMPAEDAGSPSVSNPEGSAAGAMSAPTPEQATP